MVLPSTAQEIIHARNMIVEHVQDFVVTDELLPLILKAMARRTISLRVLEMVEVFSLRVAIELSVAPTNGSPIAPSVASSPPHRAIHAQLLAEIISWSVHLTALVVFLLTD